MQERAIMLAIASIIMLLVLLIAAVFLASVIRRGYHERKYRALDRLREIYRIKLQDALEAGDMRSREGEFGAPARSLRWQAVEDVLLGLSPGSGHQREVRRLFSSLGYTVFYKKRLSRRNTQTRAMSIDKLGKMKNRSSISKLIPLLDDDKPEIVSVAVRSLCKMESPGGLKAVLERLPLLIREAKVSAKELEAALLSAGDCLIPSLKRHSYLFDDPRVAAIILAVLAQRPADSWVIEVASGQLASQNPEVRSKSLRVLGRTEHRIRFPDLYERIMPLLADPVWWVRLQAVRSLPALEWPRSAGALERLLSDEKWQVRNEAARALLALGDRSLDILLKVLAGADRYAKDSICEEIEITNYHVHLMELLAKEDGALKAKSRRVLELMHDLGFSTPHREYLVDGASDAAKRELLAILKKQPAGV